MSYLLTEIALEMLGYKFYDPNGEFHLINFQQSVPSDVHPDEPSLEDFINCPSASEPQKIDMGQLPTASANNGNNGNNPRSIPVESNKFFKSPEKSQTNSHQKPHLKRSAGLATAGPNATVPNIIPKIATNLGSAAAGSKATPSIGLQKKPSNPASTAAGSEALIVLPKISTNARRTPAKALAKIMNYENFNIRSQMLERLEGSIKKEVGISEELALQKCLDSEIEKIKRDATNMKEFRQVLEQRLRLIDVRRYDTYLRTFSGE